MPAPTKPEPTTKPASTKTRSAATWTAAAVAVAVIATAASCWHAASRDATPDAVAVFDETPLPGMFVGGGSNPPRARGATPWPARVRVERTVLTPRKPGVLEKAVQV